VDSTIVEVELPNGATALVEAREVDDEGATKTSFGRLSLDDVTDTLEGITESIRSAVKAVAPTKVSVELGIELAVKSGALVGLIVDGESKGSLTITLEWERKDLVGD
jgi:hypothetical protein